jgi:alkylation response protein AidB-like acyl-CoA dehydrogenase
MTRLGLTSDDATLFDAIDTYAQRELAPQAARLDEQAASAACHMPGLAQMGLTGLNIPEVYGGTGAAPVGIVLANIAMGKACAATCSMLGAHYLGTDAVLIGGSEAQKQKYLPGACGTDLAAFALTEPNGGSNPADLRTLAVPGEQGGVAGYRIRGQKQFISNAAEAKWIVVYAKTDPNAKGVKGISAFIVESETPGLQVAPPERTMGIRAGYSHGLDLDVFVPRAQLLGEEGSGFITAMRVLDNSRLDVAANCIGIAQAAFDCAVGYVRERVVGGEPLANKQGIQWMIADMRVRLEAAWALTLQAAAKRAHAEATGEKYSLEVSVAKLFASEMAAFVTDTALQLHGGYGFTRDLPLERYCRDARIMRIYEGSSEIQRTIIARLSLVPPKSGR